jgi:hypothetical protein
MTRRLASAATGMLIALMLPACGTATFDNTFIVVIDDPSDRLESEVAVSVFDNVMGFSRDWAQRTMGTTSPDAPYIGTVPATDTKMIFDSSPPARVAAGLAIPAYTDDGSFQIVCDPGGAEQQEITAGFAPYDERDPKAETVAPLALSVASTPGDRGWIMHVTVHIPPEPVSPTTS